MSPTLNDKELSGVCSTSRAPFCSQALAASQETFFHFSHLKLNLKNLLISAVGKYEFEYE
jgi:hypothetical protein